MPFLPQAWEPRSQGHPTRPDARKTEAGGRPENRPRAPRPTWPLRRFGFCLPWPKETVDPPSRARTFQPPCVTVTIKPQKHEGDFDGKLRKNSFRVRPSAAWPLGPPAANLDVPWGLQARPALLCPRGCDRLAPVQAQAPHKLRREWPAMKRACESGWEGHGGTRRTLDMPSPGQLTCP